MSLRVQSFGKLFAITELGDKNNKMDIKLQSGRATKKKKGILHSLCSGGTRQPEHDCNSILNFIVTCFLCYHIRNSLCFPNTEMLFN